ncbi:MAG: M50 family metallopeptidase [Elusimicrobiota bacterium]
MILSTIAVLFTFGIVIFLHEGGHFLVCRWLGVRVERFAFGFGPELLGFTSGDTRFSICAIPLGGFVKPAGEVIEDVTGAPDEYFSHSPWHRLMIVAAGPAMNYILAFLLFFTVVFLRGMPEPSTAAVIGELAPGFPAAVAGLTLGDEIVELDGIAIRRWSDMASFIHANPGKTVSMTYLHDGERGMVDIVPRLDPASGRGLIGIMPEMVYRSVGLLGSAKEGAHQCWYWTAYTVKTLKEKIVRRERPDLAGPVGIVQMVSRAAHSGLQDFIFLVGLISVAIGFFNLLPIPLLDGGHATLYLWEGISGRKLTVTLIGYANSVGLALILSLLAFATYNDVLRIHTQRKATSAAAAEQAAAEEEAAPEKTPEEAFPPKAAPVQ